MLATAIFTMALVGMHVFGTTTSQVPLYDGDFPGLTPLTLMWNGIHTERMIFSDFPKAFITLFNMSCLDGWYPVMWTFIDSNGVAATLFFITWIIVSNWLMQGLLTASIIMEMERLAREYILCASIGNKILIHNIILIKDKQDMSVAFGMLKKFAAEAEGLVVDEDEKKAVIIKEEEEPDPELPFLEKFLTERANYRMYIVKPGGKLEKFINIIKNSPIFTTSVSVAVLVSVAQILNTSDGESDGRFYFSAGG